MKTIGLILITIGFLAGSLVSVLKIEEVQWTYFVISIIVGIVGVILTHAGHKKIHTSEEALSKNITSVETSLENIVKNITDLNSQKGRINTYDVRFKIDELFPNDLAAFIEARQSISHVFGLVAYGEIMSSFAAAERYLNAI